MVKVEGLTKYFGNKLVLNQLTLDVEEKKFLVIFGPNGAGKTTLLKIISTLTRPSRGQITVGGYKLNQSPGEIRQLVGFVTHSSFLYAGLTGYENLKFYAHLYGVKRIEHRIRYLAEQVGVKEWLSERVQTYSRGMKQRLSIARALIHNPSYLLLDEPFTGLDEKMSERLSLIFQRFKHEGKTAILTTHNLAKGEFIADEVAVLNSGRLVFVEHKRRGSLQRVKKFFQQKVKEA